MKLLKRAKMGCCLGVVGLVVYGASSLFVAGRRLARATSCQANMKQVGTAILMYAEEYDSNLPSYNKWMDQGVAYSKSWNIFRCPEVPEGDGFGYGMNTAVKRPGKLKLPHKYPLIYESRDIRKNATGLFPAASVSPSRHAPSRNCIIFADGHAGWTFPVPETTNK